MTAQNIIEAIRVTLHEMPIDTVADEMLRQFMRSVVARAQRYEALENNDNYVPATVDLESSKWFEEYGHNNGTIRLYFGHGGKYVVFKDTDINRNLVTLIKQAHNREIEPS